MGGVAPPSPAVPPTPPIASPELPDNVAPPSPPTPPIPAAAGMPPASPLAAASPPVPTNAPPAPPPLSPATGSGGAFCQRMRDWSYSVDMRVVLRWVVLVAAAGGPWLWTSVARADAVPPEPLFCLSGQVGVSSHTGGSECVPKAPTDCPPGYRGVVGGKCVLAPCATDQQCETDHRCYQVDACQELRELTWTSWGWSAQPGGYSRAVPGPPPAGPAPKAWVKLHVC